MRKSVARIALAMIVLSSDILFAATSQFRTPLTFLKRGYVHYPLDYVDHAWWFDMMELHRKDTPWYVDSFKGLYARSASQSFFDECDPCGDKVTHKTVSLSTLWFGKEAFRGEEVFPGGMLPGPCSPALQKKENIALGYSRITPRFEYNEYGVYCGFDAGRTFGEDNQWVVGLRMSIPFEVITIERDQDPQLFETVDDVVMMRDINEAAGGEGSGQLDFAARFDFLNTLSFYSSGNAGGAPKCIQFVNYDVAAEGVPVKQAVSMPGTAMASASTPAAFGVTVYAIGSPLGILPDQPFRKTVAGNDIQPLPASGVLPDGNVAFFKNGTDYLHNLATDRDAQGALFIVPRAEPNGNTLTGGANSVSRQLSELLFQINALGVNTPVNFFRQAGNINLAASERITGQGDLFTEAYGGYESSTWLLYGIFGLRFPTGVKTDKVNHIYLQSTGNNGHVELKLGIDGGWKVCRWFAFELDAAYHHAFNHTEQRAAPYQGATVKNIGPAVGVDIAWDYVTAHANLNFFHPHNAELGCVFGFDFMAKSNNSACIKCPPPVDLLGRPNDTLPPQNQGYDPSLLTKNTNTMTLKLRGEVFHRWNFCEITAGAGQVVAGRNAMKESEAYLGITVYF